MEYKYNTSKHQVYLLNYHVVWCPKRRKAVLIDKIAERMEELFYEVAKENDFEIISLAIMPDHLHLFVSGRPQLSIHKTIKLLKGRTSNRLRKEFPELRKLPCLWTSSYFIATVGNASSETIEQYIKNQKGK